jgi:hypothetical protein
MNNDWFGQTPEAKDEARSFYAVGTVSLRGIADVLSEIAQKGEALSKLELKLLHRRLYDVYALIGYQTVFEMDNEDNVPTAAYQDTYSDGTPVSIVVGPPSSRSWSLPDDVYDCEIPWLPNTTGNDPYVGEGPTPPGCEVFLVCPPHRRKSNTRAMWQEAYSDVEAVKSGLVEPQR